MGDDESKTPAAPDSSEDSSQGHGSSGAPIDMRRRPRTRGWGSTSFLTRFLIVCALVLLIVGLVVHFTGIQLSFPHQQTQQDRERAVQLMQEQLVLLPPPTGSVEEGALPNTDAGHGPSLDVSYGSTAQCQEIQSYYLSLAPKAGWAVTQRPALESDQVQLEGRYQKADEEVTITLAITCYTDPAKYGSGYSLNMRA